MVTKTDRLKQLQAGAVLLVLLAGVLWAWIPVNPFRHSGSPDESRALERQSLDRILDELEQDMSSWPELSRKQKYDVIENVIQTYRRSHGVLILKRPSFYIERFDEAAADPTMSLLPIQRVMMILAVSEYDFDNGQDSEVLAKRVLGPGLYEKNRTRMDR